MFNTNLQKKSQDIFICKNFPKNSCNLWENMEKYGTAGEAIMVL